MKVNWYDRLFYGYYLMLGRLGNYDLVFSVLLLMCVIVAFNLMSTAFLIKGTEDLPELGRIELTLMALPYYVFNYYYFLKSKRYKMLEEALKDVNKKLYIWLALLSIVASIVFFFVVTVK